MGYLKGFHTGEMEDEKEGPQEKDIECTDEAKEQGHVDTGFITNT